MKRKHVKLLFFWGFIVVIALAVFVRIDAAFAALLFLIGMSLGIAFERDFGDEEIE